MNCDIGFKFSKKHGKPLVEDNFNERSWAYCRFERFKPMGIYHAVYNESSFFLKMESDL
jgi:hypothetical protein